MSNVTPITKARKKKRIGYALTVAPSDIDGMVLYEISSPDGSLYVSGTRRGTEKAVAEHYQKAVKRLNTESGFLTAKWGRKTVQNGKPTQAHPFKRNTYKEARP